MRAGGGKPQNSMFLLPTHLVIFIEFFLSGSRLGGGTCPPFCCIFSGGEGLKMDFSDLWSSPQMLSSHSWLPFFRLDEFVILI